MIARPLLAPALLLCASLALPVEAQAETRTPDRACTAGHPSISIEVDGFSNERGTVRAQLYGPGGHQFLAKGKWVMRIEQERKGPGPMHFCFPIEQAGDYAVAVRHDANANGKSDWNDGGAFTGNPKLSVFHLKPAFADASLAAGSGKTQARLIMQYRKGLSIGPLAR